MAWEVCFNESVVQEDVEASRALRSAGQDLISAQDVELAGSLLPKCDELARMADALAGALERRAAVLKLSKEMHEQIASVGLQIKSSSAFRTASHRPVHWLLRMRES